MRFDCKIHRFFNDYWKPLVLCCAMHIASMNVHALLPELHRAAREGDVDGVRRALCRGDDINIRNDIGRTALHDAAERGKRAVVTVLLDAGADIEAPDKKGYTPLYVAAFAGKRDVLRLLVRRGANVQGGVDSTRSWRVLESGDTPLHWAAQHADSESVRILLNAGADATAENSFRLTPLYELAHKTLNTVSIDEELRAEDTAMVFFQYEETLRFIPENPLWGHYINEWRWLRKARRQGQERRNSILRELHATPRLLMQREVGRAPRQSILLKDS